MAAGRLVTRICICGGGSLAHALAAVLGAHEQTRVTILTRQPARWSRTMHGLYLTTAEIRGTIDEVSSDPGVVEGADLVFIAVPLAAVDEILLKIRPSLSASAWVGAVPGYGGFDWRARHLLGPDARLFGLQRVPYVRKTVSYGEVVWISGIRPRLYVAALPAASAPEIAATIEELLNIPTTPLASYLPVNLSTTNPTFHPARIYTALGGLDGRQTFDRCELFYEEWDQAASDAFLALDRELAAVAARFPPSLATLVPILEHYGARDPAELTIKIRSIRALRDRFLPLVRADGGWRPDLFSYYFTEDIPYGLLAIRGIAEIAGVATPTTDAILRWAGSMTADLLIDDNGSIPAATRYPVPRRFALESVDALVHAAV